MEFTLHFVAISYIAGVGAELPTLPFITHEMFATAGAGVLQQAFAVEQIAMGIPPRHSTLVRTEAALPMPWA